MFRRAIHSVFISSRQITTSATSNMPIKVGDKLPSVTLFEGSPNDKVNIAELFASGKGVIFAVPGAFTPGCSKTHLPGYVQDYSKLKEKGVKTVACVSVNDPFVMAAWGEAQGAAGKIRMLADTQGEFTKAVDMELDLSAVLGTKRSQRYSLVVNDGVVTAVNQEPDGKGLTCSLSSELLKNL
ncbi:peroxiredoxin-5, mitochondrial-like [Liolophura sinensis]|uniref:peroxiredoxin-5, mitochondrial-like n=1 Tax=Liolophura sinensis TaxID=3198878 RepID=UPI0031586808